MQLVLGFPWKFRVFVHGSHEISLVPCTGTYEAAATNNISGTKLTGGKVAPRPEALPLSAQFLRVTFDTFYQGNKQRNIIKYYSDKGNYVH